MPLWNTAQVTKTPIVPNETDCTKSNSLVAGYEASVKADYLHQEAPTHHWLQLYSTTRYSSTRLVPTTIHDFLSDTVPTKLLVWEANAVCEASLQLGCVCVRVCVLMHLIRTKAWHCYLRIRTTFGIVLYQTCSDGSFHWFLHTHLGAVADQFLRHSCSSFHSVTRSFFLLFQ